MDFILIAFRATGKNALARLGKKMSYDIPPVKSAEFIVTIFTSSSTVCLIRIITIIIICKSAVYRVVVFVVDN